MADESVSVWLDHLKAGHPDAAQAIWDRYFAQLVRLARSRLADRLRRAADEEDIAISAFHSFCQAVERGRFPQLDDRDDLWRVLVMLTERKISALVERETAQKRGRGVVGGGSVFETGAVQMPAPEPTPAFAAEVADHCEALLSRLDRIAPDLRVIALAKLEGYTNPEIARQIGKSLASVERKLTLIRSVWQESLPA